MGMDLVMGNELISVGQLEFIKKSEEAYISGVEICRKLGYKNPAHQAEQIWSKHKDRLEKNSVYLKLRTTDGKEYQTLCYNEHGARFFITKCNMPLADDITEQMIVGFIFLRDAVVKLKAMRSDPDWDAIRIETKKMFRFVGMILQETRKLQGKETESYHYSNEARLMNKALTGKFDKVNRDGLSKEELKKLDNIEMDNGKMLVQGLSYNERKNFLVDKYIPKLPEC